MRIRTFSRRVALAAIAVLATALIAPAAALAATPIETLSGLVLLSQDRTPVHIYSAQLADDVKLPATVEIPIPDGKSIIWSGEVLGGDPSKDPEREVKIEKRDGYSVAIMELKTTRIGQVEIDDAKGPVSEVTTLATSLFVPAGVKNAELSVRVPTGATIKTSSEGLDKHENKEAGFTEYVKHAENVKPGTTLSAEVAYVAPLGTASNPNVVSTPAPAAKSSNSTIVLVILFAVIAGIGFLLIRSVNGRLQQKQAADDEPKSSRAAGVTQTRSESTTSKSSASKKTPKPEPKEPARRKISPAMIIAIVAVIAVVGAVLIAYEPPKKVEAGAQGEVDGVQVVQIDTSSGDFNPGEWTVKAGKPIRLVLGSGSSCASRITFPDLNIDRDLTSGATIDIPALDAGRYTYNCSSGSESGAMIVE